MKAFVFGAALAVLSVPASGAAELRQYMMQAPDTDHPGREYVANGVRVVEGQPRWTTQRRAVMDDLLALPDGDTINIVNTFRRPRWN